jgi:AmmeMemoRadiSam system protein B
MDTDTQPRLRARPAAVAGTFYPLDADELRAQVEQFLANAKIADQTVPKAIVAPHAGYIYSGPIAASVYQRLRPAAARIRRVVLLGPSHRVAFRGLAAGSWAAFETPLGQIPVDQATLRELQDEGLIGELDEAHRWEHSLEVQLPFLQSVLEDFQLLPLVVGDASAEQVGRVLERLWTGPKTLVVVSSDLSHYHSYAEAQRLDAATSEAVESLDYGRIDWEDACGRAPLSGLLWLAQRRGLKARTVDLRNSGDTAGDRNSVVGYGAYVLD